MARDLTQQATLKIELSPQATTFGNTLPSFQTPLRAAEQRYNRHRRQKNSEDNAMKKRVKQRSSKSTAEENKTTIIGGRGTTKEKSNKQIEIDLGVSPLNL